MTVTKARAALLRHVVPEGATALEADLGAWLEARDRFEAFLGAHRDKARKKLRSARDEEARRDVRAELLVAALLCGDRRFEVEYEALGSTSGGPDLTVTFRENQRFNVEVTRVRSPMGDVEARVRGVLLTKVRQLPGGVPNVLALVTAETIRVAAVEGAARELKRRADRKEEEGFTRRGYEGARAFLAALGRLSAVAVVGEVSDGERDTSLWHSAAARHAVPGEAATALARALAVPWRGVVRLGLVRPDVVAHARGPVGRDDGKDPGGTPPRVGAPPGGAGLL